MTLEVTIEALGAKGDGIARDAAGEPLYVPFALPGERVRIRTDDSGRGRIERIIEASPDRVVPPCRHFGECGGCALQHASAPLYDDWKRRLIEDALASRGIRAPLSETVKVAAGSRRRAVLSALHNGAAVRLGFHKALSHDLVDVVECVVVEPAIEAALQPLRTALRQMIRPGGTARITLLLCANGLDILIESDRTRPRDAAASVPALAKDTQAARIAMNGDILFQREKPVLHFGQVAVSPPPGAFVQAVAAASDAMAARIAAWASGAKEVADLFCGLGTFSLPLARQSRVTAFEGEPSLVSALADALRMAKGIKPVTTMRRDLMRTPLSAMELNRFDCVVFDPPRVGALAQVGEIARSRLATAIAVSCNPGTFARDARALMDGGFQLLEVVPVDQFLFSSHIEIVALFRR
jgi:23S rRNA (uracil1939-C5)-methyltransferase